MSNQLRALAEAAALKDWGTSNHTEYWAFVDGFIAGRTSVTREQIAESLEPLGDYYEGIQAATDAILALLNGETNEY